MIKLFRYNENVGEVRMWQVMPRVRNHLCVRPQKDKNSVAISDKGISEATSLPVNKLIMARLPLSVIFTFLVDSRNAISPSSTNEFLTLS